MTNSDGIYIAGRRIDTGDCSGPRSARNVLLHPDVDAAVFETARGGMLREGLAFDRCQVAVVTNIGSGDHLGLNHITTVEDLAAVKRVVVQNVAPDGVAVLNAADPMVAAMAESCPGSVTFFAVDRHHPVMATHRARRAAASSTLTATRSSRPSAVAGSALRWRRYRSRRNGSIGFQVENAMAATAAAWAAGIDWDVIRAGLASLHRPIAESAPGRFNVFDYRGATLIADYGHNPDAMRALVGASMRLTANRRLVVISGAGDRRDDDLRQQTEILAMPSTRSSCIRTSASAGVRTEKCWHLLRQGLSNATRARVVEEIRGEFLAIDTASRASSRATCAWSWSTRSRRRSPTSRSGSPRADWQASHRQDPRAGPLSRWARVDGAASTRLACGEWKPSAPALPDPRTRTETTSR